MKVEKLTLRNFRNIEESSFQPDPRLNFLIGPNGQGKTSFIEAIGYIATLRSFRGAKSDEVVRWGSEASEIQATLAASDEIGGDWRTELKVAFSLAPDPAGEARSRTHATKVAFINGKPYRSSTHYLSQRFQAFQLGFHAVVFNPSDHDLVRGEPAVRRSYLDRVLAAESVEYLKTFQKYQRALEQRNALLKSDPQPPRELLLGFTEPLVRYGAEVTLQRLQWLQRLAGRLDNVAHQIAPEQPRLKAIYLSNWVPEIDDLSTYNNKLTEIHFAGQQHVASLELLEQAFWLKLSTLERAELEARVSLVGPHRDDWTFLLASRVLKGHGSQGEVRSALVALKLSEIELFREATGHRPVLLLDDFSSELDRQRREFLLRFLGGSDLQVFVTTTEDLPYDGKRFRVLSGRIEESEPGLSDFRRV